MASIRSRKRSLLVWGFISLIILFVPIISVRRPNRSSGMMGELLNCIGMLLSFPLIPLYLLVSMHGLVVLCEHIFKSRRGFGALEKSVLVCVLFCIGCFMGHKWANHDLRVTRKEGKRLVQAIEAYSANTGEYPERLGLLTPKYIEDLPRTATMGNQPFSYWRSQDGKAFSLGFNPPTGIDPMWSWSWTKESKSFWSHD